MSSESQKAVVRRFVEEMLNGQNLDVAGDLFTEGFVDHDADDPDGRVSGVDGARAEVGVFLTAFPDMRVATDQILAEGDTVIYRGTVNGTHTGDFFGIPPTGKRMSVWVWQAFRFEGAKIAEAWLHIDRLALMQQLGLIPAPGQPVA
jgi:predicted ester cyclase